MTDLVEAVLARGQIMHCPIHIVPSLFAAMGMHAISIRSNDTISQELAFLKLRMCMLALREVRTSWPVGGWVLLLFTKVIRNLRGTSEMPPTETHLGQWEQDRAVPMTYSQQRNGDEALGHQTNGVLPSMEGAPQTLVSNAVSDSVPPPAEFRVQAPYGCWTDWSGTSFNGFYTLPNFALGGGDIMNDPSLFSMSNAFLG